MDSQVVFKTATGFKVFVTNPEACELINRRLRHYPLDAELTEGIFPVTQGDYPFVKAVLHKFGLLDG